MARPFLFSFALRRPVTAVLGASFALVACAPAAAPRLSPSPCAPAQAASKAASVHTSSVPISLDVLLTPRPATSTSGAVLSVDMTLNAQAPSFPELSTLRVAHGTPAALAGLTLVDAAGPIAADLVQDGAGLLVRLARPVGAPLRIKYDVAASTSVDASTSSVVVADDRFRAFGEDVILLPEAALGVRAEIELRIDGQAIRAPSVASSFGAAASGAPLRRVAHGRALVRSAFMAGSLGRASFDDAAGEHDEAAWLGYTEFDPRPVAAEIALVRSALGEM